MDLELFGEVESLTEVLNGPNRIKVCLRPQSGSSPQNAKGPADVTIIYGGESPFRPGQQVKLTLTAVN